MTTKKQLKKVSSAGLIEVSKVNELCLKASEHIDAARRVIRSTVDTEMIKAYWFIGRDIVEVEQGGEERASYGQRVIKELSKKLQEKYLRGFSKNALAKARKFYLLYQEVGILPTVSVKSATLSRKSGAPKILPGLSWSHYVELISIKREEARGFYTIEASKNSWTVRELRRQIDSFLYDRLLKSKNKEQLLALAKDGQEIIKPEDALKEPFVLEFLGVPESHKLSETDLESAIINNLKSFLLEMGKGFAFVERQKRLTLDRARPNRRIA